MQWVYAILRELVERQFDALGLLKTFDNLGHGVGQELNHIRLAFGTERREARSRTFQIF